MANASLVRRLWRRPSVRWAVAVIAVLYVVAVLAPLLAPYNPAAQPDIVALKSQPPSWAHPFGTDRFSRDVLSRVMYGARISLAVATISVALAATVGAAYGMIAGFLGGATDAVMMRLLDGLLSIPKVLLLVAILSLWSPVPLPGLVLILGLSGWFEVSRIVRAEVMAAKRREYVLAAHALGAPARRLLRVHVLPNVLPPLVVATTLNIANLVILEAGLSFLGVGAREPTASWGTIFQDGSDAFAAAWWVVLFPGLAMLMTVLAFNTLGDALQGELDPRQVAREP